MPSAPVLAVISCLIIFVPAGSWNYQQRMIPLKKERIGMYIQIFMAVLSLGLNLLLIPRIGLWGVAVSYMAAEISGTLIGIVYLYKLDRYNMFKLNYIKLLAASAVMAGILFLFNLFIADSWLFLFMKVTAGILIYFVVLLVLKEKTIFGLKNKIFKKEKPQEDEAK